MIRYLSIPALAGRLLPSISLLGRPMSVVPKGEATRR
jgi:hypothetical protein